MTFFLKFSTNLRKNSKEPESKILTTAPATGDNLVTAPPAPQHRWKNKIRVWLTGSNHRHFVNVDEYQHIDSTVYKTVHLLTTFCL
jgi:hypothetical protein